MASSKSSTPRAPAAKKKPAEQHAGKAPKPLTPFQRWAQQPGAIDALCDEVAQGDNLWAYTQRIGIPYSTTSDWIGASQERADKYARAREARADKLADEIVAISDEVEVSARHDGEDVRLAVDAAAIARNRLRVDARKWVASKLKPRVYGDKVQHGGDPDAPPIQHSMAVEFVKP